MDDTKAIRVIAFEDSEDDYRFWSKHFQSAATVRAYREILTDKKIKVPKHTKILTDTDKEGMRLRKANKCAYYDLVLACKGDIGFD